MIDLDPEQPCEVLPGAAPGGGAAGGAQRIEEVAEKVVKMNGGSGEKVAGGDDEGTTTPVPDKVQSFVCSSVFVFFLYILHTYIHLHAFQVSMAVLFFAL